MKKFSASWNYSGMTIDKIHLKKLLQLISYFMMKGDCIPNTASKMNVLCHNSFLTTVLKFLATTIKQQKEIKDMLIVKRNKRVPICRCCNCLHRKPRGIYQKKKRKPSTTNRIEVSKVSGKQNEPTRKNKSQFYIKNEHVVNIKNTISGVFTIAQRKLNAQI